MMAGVCKTVFFLLSLGYVQCEPIQQHEPAIIEDLPRAGDLRIVAGWPAEDGQFPHQASLRAVSPFGRLTACGASFIHHEWILTAAHCLGDRILFVISLGGTNLTRPEYIVESDRRFMHPNYQEFNPFVQDDDIALIQLHQAIPYGRNIQPIRLQSSAQKDLDYSGVRMTASGWGRNEDLVNNGTTQELLHWVYLRGISNIECGQWYSGITDETICAEYYNDTAQSPCQGDSGGPLTVIDKDGEPTLVGIVSFGSSAGCNSPWPTAFVRPGYYHEWLQNVTSIDFDWSADFTTTNLAPPVTEESDESSSSSNDSDESSSSSTDSDESSSSTASSSSSESD